MSEPKLSRGLGFTQVRKVMVTSKKTLEGREETGIAGRMWGHEIAECVLQIAGVKMQALEWLLK